MIDQPPPPVVASDHPAYVRVIIGVGATSQQVEASDPRPEDDGKVALQVSGLTLAEPLTMTVRGITVTIASGSITLRGKGFKYMSQTATGRRVIVDLWKARARVNIKRGRAGCLELSSVRRHGSVFVVRGRERRLFEHSFFVVLRGRDGRELRVRPGTGDRWTVRLRTRGRPRMIEAAASSARDGSLVCLVQRRV